MGGNPTEPSGRSGAARPRLGPWPGSAARPEAVGVRAQRDRGHEAAHVEVGAWLRAVEPFSASKYILYGQSRMQYTNRILVQHVVPLSSVLNK
jgi:hypothetical protein